MKKIFILNLILFFNFLNVLAEEKIHYLDIDFILNNSNSGKIVISKLNDINSKNILNLKKKKQELKDLESEISRVKNVISEKDLEDKINNLKDKIKIYRLEKDKKVKEFNILRDKELNFFFKTISPLIEEFMKKNSVSIIIDKKNIFIANSKYDITDGVIEFLNKQN